MRRFIHLTRAAVAAVVLTGTPLAAQDHGAAAKAPPAAKAASAHDAKAEQDHAAPARPAPAAAAAKDEPHAGPVVAPAKPVVAPKISVMGDASAAPVRPRARGKSALSAKESAEKTVAALAAAMSAIEAKPAASPAPTSPASRATTSPTTAARGATARRGRNAAAAPPKTQYPVTWPSRNVEVKWPQPADRVELDWPGDRPAAVVLRWETPPPR